MENEKLNHERFLTIEEYFKEIDEEAEKSLLLGNGFSINLHSKFNYKELLEEAEKLIDKDTDDDKILELFKSFNTSSFEEVMHGVHTTEMQLAILINSFKPMKWREKVKNLFMKTIRKVHPNHLGDLDNWHDQHKESLKKFFRSFKFLFTTNYDLSLVWLRQELSIQKRFTDGFSGKDNLVWSAGQQKLSYLHGALHLIDKYPNGKTIKLKYDKETILDQLDKILERKNGPVIVLEGTSRQKKLAINHSEYLRHCHEKLKDTKKYLFIHGFSFNENDEHIYGPIFENLKKGNLKGLYISLTRQESNTRKRVDELIKKYDREIKEVENKVSFYQADSIFKL